MEKESSGIRNNLLVDGLIEDDATVQGSEHDTTVANTKRKAQESELRRRKQSNERKKGHHKQRKKVQDAYQDLEGRAISDIFAVTLTRDPV